MSNYKLIKKYPGSPELGTIVNYSEKHKVYNHNGGDYHTELPKHQVENLPEYWEMVEEKDYEIIAFKNPANDITFEKCNNGTFTSCGSEFGLGDTEHFLSKRRHKIYSVKRLSDGEVFTIGDEVREAGTKYSREIDRIQLTNGEIIIRYFISWTKLRLAVKVKEPLFTTEDGVDIYEADEYWIVDRNWVIKSSHGGNNPIEITWRVKLSTKEKTEEYVNNYKPQYSKNDIKEAISNSKLSIHGEHLYKSQLEYELDLN